MLNELLFAKWLDPIASSMAAYELVRRGRKNQMADVVSNMKRFFPDLPTPGLSAKLNGEPIDQAPRRSAVLRWNSSVSRLHELAAAGWKPGLCEYLDGVARGLQSRPLIGLVTARTTGFVSVPIPSYVQTDTSPGLKKIGGFLAEPTPAGLPVAITSPGRSVRIFEA